MGFSFTMPYQPADSFSRPVAYFCMEFGIHQPLKTYAGGLGFLAVSHMRSAFQLKQNLVGIGILWKYGYYNQVRKHDSTMDVAPESFDEIDEIIFACDGSKSAVHAIKQFTYLFP